MLRKSSLSSLEPANDPSAEHDSTPAYLPFDRVADIYEQTRYIPAEILRQIASLIVWDMPMPFASPFLDAGIGTGRFARALTAQEVQVVGVDISSAMLAEAQRQMASNYRGTMRNLVHGDLRKLPFQSEMFGGALLVHILHLIADWQSVLLEVRRVLQPGASLYLGSENGKNFATRTLYFQIATERRLLRQPVGSPSFAAVLDYLAESGARCERIDRNSIQWVARTTTTDMMQTLRRNAFSHLWHLSPDEHADLVREVEQRLREESLAKNEIEEAPASFRLWRVRWE